MKRILTFILVFLVICATLIFCASCYSTASGGLLYTEVDGGYQVTGASITKGRFSTPIIVIPREFNGKPVIAISDGAFAGYTGLTKIEIPDTVTAIGEGAFTGCISLSEVDMPDSVRFIGGGAFSKCINLSSISFSNSLERIESGAFMDCVNLKEIVIPDSVTYISYEAFMNCSNLQRLVLGDSVTTIEEGGFFGFPLLEEVVIGESISLLDPDAFFNNYNFPNIKFNEYDNALYLGTEENPYYLLFRSKSTDITSCKIHEDTVVINYGAFRNNRAIKEISIPDSVLRIGDSAFAWCNLDNVYIGANSKLESIGDKAFFLCNLTDVRIPDSVVSIGQDAFRANYMNCNEYGNALYIGNENNPYHVLLAPKDTNITDCTIHEDTKIICSLNDCIYLESIVIPDSVINISGAFRGCHSLKEVTFGSSITSIGSNTFEECESLESIIIPETVKNIGDYAFNACTSLNNISIPSSVTTIGACAFGLCSSLESINIPSSVREIGCGAFYYCQSLSEIVIPASVVYMESNIFDSCDNIKIYCEAIARPVTWNSYWNLRYAEQGNVFDSFHKAEWGYTGE